MGCLKSTKGFFLRMLCCKHRGRARVISIVRTPDVVTTIGSDADGSKGRPTNFRKEDPYNSGLGPESCVYLHRICALRETQRSTYLPRDSIANPNTACLSPD